ncbi:hypothetical protein [Treponema denticola]|nr:hypothetical protein [Treponema denticola]
MSDIANNAIVDVDFDTPFGKLHIHYDDNDNDKEKDDDDNE